MGEVNSDYPWISIPFTSFDASTTGSRPPELHRLLQDSTGIRTHCGCACGVVLRVQPLISQKIWSVDFECSDKCMVLWFFYHVFCPEVSASIFQNSFPGATGVLPRFGSFRSQSGCAFESTILPPCVRELMWLVRMGAIWIDMGSVACVFLKTPRWSGWRDRKDHDDVMDSDFSNFPKKIEEWSNLKDTYIQDAKSFLWDLRSRIGCSKVLCEIHQFMMEYPNFYEFSVGFDGLLSLRFSVANALGCCSSVVSLWSSLIFCDR